MRAEAFLAAAEALPFGDLATIIGDGGSHKFVLSTSETVNLQSLNFSGRALAPAWSRGRRKTICMPPKKLPQMFLSFGASRGTEAGGELWMRPRTTVTRHVSHFSPVQDVTFFALAHRTTLFMWQIEHWNCTGRITSFALVYARSSRLR